MLPGVIKQARVLTERGLDDFVEALAFVLCTLQQVVAVVDIGEIVLVVVVLERFRDI